MESVAASYPLGRSDAQSGQACVAVAREALDALPDALGVDPGLGHDLRVRLGDVLKEASNIADTEVKISGFNRYFLGEEN